MARRSDQLIFHSLSIREILFMTVTGKILERD